MLQLNNDYFIEAENFGYSLHRLEPIQDETPALEDVKQLLADLKAEIEKVTV